MSAAHEEGDGGPATSRALRLTPALVVVAFVTLVVVIAAGTAGGWHLEPRGWFDGQALSGERTPVLMEPLQPQAPPVSQAGPLQRAAGAVMALMLLTLLAGMLYFLARWLWRRRPRRAVVLEDVPDTTPAGVLAPEPDLPTLLRGAEDAVSILTEAGGVPRDLIMRCWLALEEAAAASGAARKPSDSPTEFTGAVLRSTATDATSIDNLLRIYHRARFSDHPITDDDVRTARSAVVRLAATWRGFDTALRQTARTDS